MRVLVFISCFRQDVTSGGAKQIIKRIYAAPDITFSAECGYLITKKANSLSPVQSWTLTSTLYDNNKDATPRRAGILSVFNNLFYIVSTKPLTIFSGLNIHAGEYLEFMPLLVHYSFSPLHLWVPVNNQNLNHKPLSVMRNKFLIISMMVAVTQQVS